MKKYPHHLIIYRRDYKTTWSRERSREIVRPSIGCGELASGNRDRYHRFEFVDREARDSKKKNK